MEQGALMPHLFRTEYRKIVAVLCNRFGFGQIEIAEDIASDTFLTAVQSWGLEGIPSNPTAWLYTVARNKAINHLQRASVYERKIMPGLKGEDYLLPADEIDLSPENIQDSQLQMMFAICHPSISPEAQIGLSLRILCGFGIDEIADAFLTGRETINKRLTRARARLREEKVSLSMPDPTVMDERLETVLTTIYLLFNEGYYSFRQDKTVRKELCLEAMRLCTMLVENKNTNKPQVNALLALMCFHASRLEARMDENGMLILYDEQDTALWNEDLIAKGGYFLQRAGTGDTLSRYHLEAAIAWWHTQTTANNEKWQHILQLYDQLLQQAWSPMAALNRIFALSKVAGKTAAIHEAESLNMPGAHLYFTLLGELYTGIDKEKAKQNFQAALKLASSDADKKIIRKKLEQR